MKKKQALAYLDSLNIDKMRFGLGAIRRLLAGLGHPQKTYQTIMIGGTNGKGSTAAMLAAILRSAGYNVGLYTSPHLVDVRERIAVNGKMISVKDFCGMVRQVKNKVRERVTYFEFLTAAALVYFRTRRVDVAVLEVGLGGRLDATNVCSPLVSIITNIDYDHTAYLGNTLASIAAEKAGIIKRNGCCVTGAKQKAALDVLEAVCKRRRSGLYLLGRDINMIKHRDGCFSYRGLHRNLDKIAVSLRGEHQLFNAALALAAVEICTDQGVRVDDRAIYAGLARTRWAARLDVLRDKPLFLLDGAHNPAGMDALCRTLQKDFSGRPLILIFGSLVDKNYRGMLKRIVPLAQTVIVTPLNTGRTACVSEIGEVMRGMKRKFLAAHDVSDAVRRSLEIAGENDVICATGSFYLAGEVKQAFPKRS